MSTFRQQIRLIKQYVNIQNKDHGVSKLFLFIAPLKILIQLPINAMFRLRLKFYKQRHQITKPIIHYYTVTWNEEKILPFMLDHYKSFVDQFFVYDNYSTDSSTEVLLKHKNVKILKFDTGNSFNDLVHIKIKNRCWKKSRGKADYVIVCDADEFLFHPNMEEFLLQSQKEKISFFNPIGYDMYSDSFPEHQREVLITTQVRNGVPDRNYNKSIIFDPHRIVEINYTAGAHFCYPWGIVRTKEDNQLLLLHYKNLGVDYVLNRCNMYRHRLSDANMERSYGAQYLQEDQKITQEIESKINESKPVI